jgi:hypothetical protein
MERIRHDTGQEVLQGGGRRKGCPEVLRAVAAAAMVASMSMTLAACDIGAATADERVEVREALVAWLMTTEAPPGERVACVAFNTGEAGQREAPPAETLQRLRQHATSVHPGDECALESAAGSIVHTPTGRPAVLYEAQLIYWGNEEAQLRGAYYRASLDSQSCTYSAHPTAAGWEFTAVGECALS